MKNVHIFLPMLRLPPPPPVFACAFKWAICYAEQAVQAHAEDWLHKERRSRLLPGFPVTMPSIGAACSTGQSKGDSDDHHLLKSLPGLPFEASIRPELLTLEKHVTELVVVFCNPCQTLCVSLCGGKRVGQV